MYEDADVVGTVGPAENVSLRCTHVYFTDGNVYCSEQPNGAAPFLQMDPEQIVEWVATYTAPFTTD